MNLLERLRGEPKSMNLDALEATLAAYRLADGSIPWGLPYGGREEQITPDFLGYVHGTYRRNGPVFACLAARMRLFSDAPFIWQDVSTGKLFGDPSLSILEHPWPNATTRDLNKRALLDADLAGNFFATERNGQIKRMRPDWTTIVIGSNDDPEVEIGDLDAEVIGYVYRRDGQGPLEEGELLLPNQVCHFAPLPDPCASFRGMSWLTPVLREITADGAASAHKLKFFENGGTPQVVVKLSPDLKPEAFNAWVEKFKEQGIDGVENAYRTLYLAGGADVTVVGANLRQLDFRAVQGAGETRIASAAGVPPIIVGFSESLQGSSLNAGNFTAARRLFSDLTMRELWGDWAGSMQTLVSPPNAQARLWTDDRAVSFLQDDHKDAAEVQQFQSAAISTLITAGYEPDSVVRAITSGDLTLLKHTGLTSVQLLPPGEHAGSNGSGSPAAVPAP